MKVLHWPKLFDGWVRITGEYRNHGDGDLTGDGLGGGYIGGAIARRGNGTGSGKGSHGSGGGYTGAGSGNGGGAYANRDGNGWSKQSV